MTFKILNNFFSRLNPPWIPLYNGLKLVAWFLLFAKLLNFEYCDWTTKIQEILRPRQIFRPFRIYSKYNNLAGKNCTVNFRELLQSKNWSKKSMVKFSRERNFPTIWEMFQFIAFSRKNLRFLTIYYKIYIADKIIHYSF